MTGVNSMLTYSWRTIRPSAYRFSLAKRRIWRADEPPSTEPPAPDKDADAAASAEDKPAPKTFDEAYVKELRSENADWRKKFRDLEKRMGDFEAKKKQAEEDELKEQNLHKELADRYKADLDKAKAELETERINNLKIRVGDRKSTRLNSSHHRISYAVFCL